MAKTRTDRERTLRACFMVKGPSENSGASMTT